MSAATDKLYYRRQWRLELRRSAFAWLMFFALFGLWVAWRVPTDRWPVTMGISALSVLVAWTGRAGMVARHRADEFRWRLRPGRRSERR